MLSREAFLAAKPDYSDVLFHFTRAAGERDACENLAEILGRGRIEAGNPHCMVNGSLGRVPEGIRSSFNVACFTECRVEALGNYLAPVAGRQFQPEPYGIGVTKQALLGERGVPVAYAPWPASKGFGEIWDKLSATGDWNALAEVMPFVSVLRDTHDFHWEREWRVNHDLRIQPGSVAYVVCPESDEERLALLLNHHPDGVDWFNSVWVDPWTGREYP